MLAFVSLLAPFSTINVQQKPDVPLVAPPEPHPCMTGFEAQGEMFDFWCPKGKTTRVHLVHVGKTAGKTVAALLKSNGVTVCQHHVVTKRYDVMSHSRWVVTTRDPISRTISAFNWGKEGGIQRTTFRTCGSSWCSLSPWKEMLQRSAPGWVWVWTTGKPRCKKPTSAMMTRSSRRRPHAFSVRRLGMSMRCLRR